MENPDIVELKEQYDKLKHVLTYDEKKKIRQLIGLELPDFIEWVESEFYIPETKRPMKLYWLQKAAIREAMRTDDNGKFVYSTVMWGDIKKSAKTCIAAARALWVAVHEDFATVRVVGNDLKQAQSRMFEYIIRCVKLNHRLRESLGIHQVRNEIIIEARNSTIEAIAVDPEGEAGGGDSLVGFTELWGASSVAHIKLWTELTLSPLKYGYSQRWCESYAGIRGRSPLLEMIYDKCVVVGDESGEEVNNLGGKKLDIEIEDDTGKKVKAPFYTDATNNIFCMWNRAPHVPWQTAEYYENERATILEHEYQRVHRNTFIEPQQKFIDNDKLYACYGPYPPLTPQTVMVLAGDAAYKKDSYGLVGVTYNPEDDIVTLVYEHEWVAAKGKEIDLSQPEKVIRRLAKKYKVLVWAYDPYQLKRTAQSFSSDTDTPIPTYEFTQQGKRSVADKALLDRISTHDLVIPQESLTAQHIKNADMKVIDSTKVRMVKRPGSSGGPIDLAVALSMATYVAVSERDKFPIPTVFNSDSGGQHRKYPVASNKPIDVGVGVTLPNDRTMTRLPIEIYERG